eukprot:jgi/Chlat1/2502/Chrsp175S08715
MQLCMLMQAMQLVAVACGGQTGADRAAAVAVVDGEVDKEDQGRRQKRRLKLRGWCPKGKLAEDGQIPARYAQYFTETPSADYAQRTAWNVRDSDATLILTISEPSVLLL